MTLKPPIAIGFTAEIHSWKDGQVLKLFNQGISRSTVEYEANITRLVHATGMPVPSAGEIIEIDNRFGLEYERVEGMTMLQALMKRPWKFPLFARQLAEIQVEMHTCRVPGLPSQRDRLELKINRACLLPNDVRQAALHALAGMPDDDKLCHGDFHPGNIVLTSRGPVVIDWIDASRGSPIMDVARSTLLMGGGALPPGTPVKWLVRLLRGWSYKIYLKHYFQLSTADRNQLSHWVPVAAAARLDENIQMDEDRLLALAKQLIQSP
jgi:uncharacterized protein (TIGR02172 family)